MHRIVQFLLSNSADCSPPSRMPALKTTIRNSSKKRYGINGHIGRAVCFDQSQPNISVAKRQQQQGSRKKKNAPHASKIRHVARFMLDVRTKILDVTCEAHILDLSSDILNYFPHSSMISVLMPVKE